MRPRICIYEALSVGWSVGWTVGWSVGNAFVKIKMDFHGFFMIQTVLSVIKGRNERGVKGEEEGARR